MKPVITIYCDGSVRDNTDPLSDGGIGCVLFYNNTYKEISGYLPSSQTNNTAELLALLIALKQLKTRSILNIYSDSMLVVKYFSRGKRWKRKVPRLIEIAEQIDKLLESHSYHTFHVKGHEGNIWNERCDELAEIGKQSLNTELQIKYITYPVI